MELKRGKGRAPVLQDGSLFVPGEDGQLGRRVEAFLKLGARDALSTACDGYSAQIGREYGRLTLRDVRSRWGSCTTEGNLMFSWRLIMAPPEILNYVAAHEVAHLAEMNHAPAFWEIVRTLDPNFKEHRHWLRENGAQLLQWVFRD